MDSPLEQRRDPRPGGAAGSGGADRPEARRRGRDVRGKHAVLGLLLALAAAAPSAALEAVSALSYYMDEVEGRLVLTGLPAVPEDAELRADVLAGERVLARGAPVVQGRRPWVAFPLDSLPTGHTELTCRLRSGGQEAARARAVVRRLPPRANAVQVDRLGGGLRVDGLPWFPFGFYCYWPVQPTLAGEEAARGFNLMSPYQPNDPGTLEERIAYLDRAAALGMKVHYQLLDVSGGGGVYSGSGREIPPEQRDEWLRTEIEAVRDHPALLAWYIADEPGLRGVDPEAMQRLYDRVRELDPYHPVTMVFLNAGAGQRFAAALDLAMIDPYPIPNAPPATVGPAVAAARQGLGPRIPVWLVGQAFGGGEHWTREPTARELRLMTWLALVEGATGVQYFIRHGLSGFPKSPATWAAAGRAALEVQALAPHLLSREPQPLALSPQEGGARRGLAPRRRDRDRRGQHPQPAPPLRAAAAGVGDGDPGGGRPLRGPRRAAAQGVAPPRDPPAGAPPGNGHRPASARPGRTRGAGPEARGLHRRLRRPPLPPAGAGAGAAERPQPHRRPELRVGRVAGRAGRHLRPRRRGPRSHRLRRRAPGPPRPAFPAPGLARPRSGCPRAALRAHRRAGPDLPALRLGAGAGGHGAGPAPVVPRRGRLGRLPAERPLDPLPSRRHQRRHEAGPPRPRPGHGGHGLARPGGVPGHLAPHPHQRHPRRPLDLGGVGGPGGRGPPASRRARGHGAGPGVRPPADDARAQPGAGGPRRRRRRPGPDRGSTCITTPPSAGSSTWPTPTRRATRPAAPTR